jgi:hypothetical protein
MKFTCRNYRKILDKPCGHTWITRSEEPPKKCPKCMSPNWSKPEETELVKEYLARGTDEKNKETDFA